MAAQQQQKVTLVADFIDRKAPQFHRAFGTPSTLNRSTMQYERPEVRDLRETLECHHQIAAKYVDFTSDLNNCTWEIVHEELRKAQVMAAESERRGKNVFKKAWRSIGSTSSILAPGLAAIPEELRVLQAGLAVIFSLARHSEMNRLKILATFETVPNIIEMARNKSETFPLDSNSPKSVKLHNNVQELQATLLRILPVLINKLIPGTFFNAWKSPFGTWKIEKLLEEVSVCAESVRVSAEGLIEDLLVNNYSASMTIQSQLGEVLRQQRTMQMSIEAAHGKTHLLHFLMEQLNFNAMGALSGRDQADMSDMGTALPGYTPEDLLKIINVNHMRISNDAVNVVRKGPTFEPADIQRAAHVIVAPQVKELLSTSGPSVVAIDGHFDRTQIGKISPLSYVCAMLSQALRQQSQQYAAPSTPGSPTSLYPEKATSRTIVLEYFCALHTADDDDLKGPQGLVRCLITQLILSLVANEWVGHADAVHLPHLRDGEEELLIQYNLDAICRLFTALIHLVPRDVPIHCLVDGWSVYEREELWQADYNVVLHAFREAADASNPDSGANFKLLITSPTACRWLDDFLLPGQKVSLRSHDAGGGSWRGAGKTGLMELARAATTQDVSSGLGGGFPVDEYGQTWTGEEHDRRSST